MTAKTKGKKTTTTKRTRSKITDDQLKLFAENYRISGGNASKAYRMTFDTSKITSASVNSLANRLMRAGTKSGDKIKKYLEELTDSAENRMKHENAIAKGDEIAAFFSRVMRGEEKDAFDLDVGIDSRIKAAENLAKINQMYTQNINLSGLTQVQIIDDMGEENLKD